MKILISGVGIAGPTLAFWLKQYGYEPTLIERAPKLRTAGYVIDFWGAGFDIAEKMGLIPELLARGYQVKEVQVVDGQGKRKSGFSAGVARRLTEGRFVSVARGDLAALIYEKIPRPIEVIFDDEIESVEQSESTAHVSFRRSPPRDFDLVIGCDGLHSKVRELVFGEESRYEKYLGLQVAAFEARGYRPRDEDLYLTYTQVGQQIARFTQRGDRTLFLFIFAAEDGDLPTELEARKQLLRERFGGKGWESDAILSAMKDTTELYFDRVSQIQVPEWSRGRVAVTGDAAFCVSFLAGQGSALAMIAGYVLAGELHRARGDYREAYRRYEERLGAFISKKQKAAVRFASAFCPKTSFGLFFRDQVLRALALPFVAELAMGPGLRDRLELPEY